MQKNTGFPSIDKKHEVGASFFMKHPFIPNISIYNALKIISKSFRNEIAIDCDDTKITYAELFQYANILADSLTKLGICKQNIITVVMPNFWHSVVLFLAANKIGAAITFINPASSEEEIKKYVDQFHSPLLVNYYGNCIQNDSLLTCKFLEKIVTIYEDERTFINTEVQITSVQAELSFSQLYSLGSNNKSKAKNSGSGNNCAVILYTSGSTGEPKSVVLTNQNIIASAIYHKHSTKIQPVIGERCLVCVPFSYPYGFITSVLTSLLCGRIAILATNMGPQNTDYYFSKRPNYIFGSPAVLEFMKQHISKNMDLSSIHTFISGGDFLSPSTSEAGKKYFSAHSANVQICNGSGNAEGCGSLTTPLGSTVKISTVGKPLIGTSAIIVDPDSFAELKYGEEGMLCVSGKHIFKEYFNEPSLTKDAKFKYKGKEFLKTGTMGILDVDGYFTLTGRASRFYIRSDFNKVYCEHIQGALSQIDCVKACAVVKKPDDNLIYVSKAFIVLNEGITPDDGTKTAILDECQSQVITSKSGDKIQIKEFEIPAEIVFVKSLPRTKADKIDYELLEGGSIDGILI